jgi:hypothetical protein
MKVLIATFAQFHGGQIGVVPEKIEGPVLDRDI